MLSSAACMDHGMSVVKSAPPHPDPLIEINDVHFAYDERPILRGLTLNVRKGEVLAVMGGSGSGKTTLLGLIGGRILPNKGKILVDGQNVPKLDRTALYALRTRFGMLFQFGALFTDLSVFDNVAFPYREQTNLPESVIRDLVLLKLQAVGLRGAAGLMPSQLSGGMARRVALARAVAFDPMLMLYDEPFTGLDPISTGIVGRLIRRLNDAFGLTSLVVTHDLDASLKIADRVIVLAEGQVYRDLTPDEVGTTSDAFVRQFADGLPDGPVPFHYPAPPLLDQLLGKTVAGPNGGVTP
jgi:phospholipid/cholesterol/gamma-HCH transport system ATP-binding protein